jgi:hypothetical protein
MRMGPHRDIVGEMVQAVRRQGMKVVVTFHHMRWDYYNAGRTLCPPGVGVNDPKLSGLYGRAYDLGTPEAGSWLVRGRLEKPRQQQQPAGPIFESFREEGYNKFIEVIDKYQPDQIQTDGLTCVRLGQDRLQKVLAHHFNSAERSGRDVLVSRGYDSHHPYVPSEMWGKEVMSGVKSRIPSEAGTLRFTRKGPYRYAIDLIQPTAPTRIPGVTPMQGSHIRLLGSDKDLAWRQEGADIVIDELPDPLPGNYAWVFKIRLSDTAEETRRIRERD